MIHKLLTGRRKFLARRDKISLMFGSKVHIMNSNGVERVLKYIYNNTSRRLFS